MSIISHPPPVNIAAALRRRIVNEAVIEAERARGYAEGFAAAREAYLAQAVRLANCPQCWARPGRPCTVTGPPGDHLARYQRAERRGLIGRENLAAVVAGLEVIAAHVIIREA